jgi:phosphonate metabolism-associated iron-containing alcohol dehydrogenase
MKPYQYYLPTKIVFGTDSIAKLPDLIKENFPKKTKILLVTGRYSLKKAGITDKVLKILKKYTVVLFDKVEPNPTSDIVDAGIEEYKKNKCDMVVAVGGGSVIDTGKAIAILVNNKGSLESFQKGKEPTMEPETLIAVPTTSGTSSEMTIWSIITNLKGEYKNTKKSFASIKMYPKIAVIDPRLTTSLNAKQTASTGLDALSHSMEGYWSRKTNPLSNIYAINAIKLIVRYLPRAVQDGEDLEAREKMSLATFLAGLAFSNSRTGHPHKISYPITTQYNLPHGAACTITLPYFMEYIGDKDESMIEEVTQALGFDNYKSAVDFLKNFIKDLGMPNKLSDLGIEKEDLPHIAKKTYMPVEKQVEPVDIDYKDYLQILENAL